MLRDSSHMHLLAPCSLPVTLRLYFCLLQDRGPVLPLPNDSCHSLAPSRLQAPSSISKPLLLRPNTQPSFNVVTPIPLPFRPRSSLRPARWRTLLARYPDPAFPALLANIATHGARAGYLGPYVRIRGRNHSSAYRISQDITQNIIDEIAAGHIVPLSSLPHTYYISPLGAVGKKQNGQCTGWRRIHDLSYPRHNSVNDSIPITAGSLHYQTLDDAIQLIASAGQYAFLRKRDLKDAFRMIPLLPYDYWLFLFEWQGALYVDICLPFGLRTSPFIFNLFAEGLH